jgi:hypothetical protein
MNAGDAAPAAPIDRAGGEQRQAHVLAAGVAIGIADYEADPARFSRDLARAKAEHGHALCLCTEPRPQLVVRRVPGPEGDRHFLATWPNGGTAHARGCRFFRSEDQYEDARARAQAAVIEDEGGFNIKPGFSLRRVEAGAAEETHRSSPPRSEPTGGPATAQRASLGLPQTLDYLWRAAGLGHDAGDRRWGDVVASLANVIAQGTVGAMPLAAVMHLVPVFDSARKSAIDADWMAFLEQFHRTERTVPLFLVLGEVKATQRAGQAVATHLRHFAPLLFMSTGLGKALADRFPAAEACLADPSSGERVVGLFQCEISARNKLWVNDAALLRVTRHYAPSAGATAA